jgi:hypothetical protein
VWRRRLSSSRFGGAGSVDDYDVGRMKTRLATNMRIRSYGHAHDIGFRQTDVFYRFHNICGLKCFEFVKSPHTVRRQEDIFSRRTQVTKAHHILFNNIFISDPCMFHRVR